MTENENKSIKQVLTKTWMANRFGTPRMPIISSSISVKFHVT